MFYSSNSLSTGKFIVYSSYGLQSHIVMNNYGVIFSCNPKTQKGTVDANSLDGYCANIYDSKAEAAENTDTFYDIIHHLECCCISYINNINTLIMNTVITYYITRNGKEWYTDTDIEKATIKADDIKGQVFVWKEYKQIVLVYSHEERQLRLS